MCRAVVEVCTQMMYRGVYKYTVVRYRYRYRGVSRCHVEFVHRWGMLMGTARGGDRHPDLHGLPLIALVLTNMVLVMVVSTRRLSLRW